MCANALQIAPVMKYSEMTELKGHFDDIIKEYITVTVGHLKTMETRHVLVEKDFTRPYGKV